MYRVELVMEEDGETMEWTFDSKSETEEFIKELIEDGLGKHEHINVYNGNMKINYDIMIVLSE